MLHLLVNSPTLGVRVVATVDEVREALRQPDHTVWVDFDGRSAESDALLEQLFGFHPLAIEDVYKEGHNPKVEDYERYLYVVVQALTCERDWDFTNICLTEVDLFLGSNFVVTHHAGCLPAIDAVREPTLARGKNHMQKGAVWLTHALLDSVVDRFAPLSLALEREIDALEVQVLRGRDETVLVRVLDLIRTLHHLRRVALRQRELLERLAHAEFDEIPGEAKPFFRDVHEHFKDFTESMDIMRDDLASIFNAFHSLASQRMNEVMKVLTALSAVVLPPTLIAGVYGMNFRKFFPELDWEYGYVFAIALMTLSTVLSLVYFRHRRWL